MTTKYYSLLGLARFCAVALIFSTVPFAIGTITAQSPAITSDKPNGDSTDSAVSPITFGAYLDAYYAYAFAPPPAGTRSYTTQPLYHNELAVNFAFLSAEYASGDVRGRLAVQFGSYVEANYAAEPDFWRNIYEAYAGYRIAENL